MDVWIIVSWVGGFFPVLIIASLLGMLLRAFRKMPATRALGICALPAGIISTVLYGFSSAYDGRYPFFEGAIGYSVPAIGLLIFGLAVSARKKAEPHVVEPAAVAVEPNALVEPDTTARPPEPFAVSAQVSSKPAPMTASKKGLNGVMRIRIVLAAVLWLIGTAYFTDWLLGVMSEIEGLDKQLIQQAEAIQKYALSDPDKFSVAVKQNVANPNAGRSELVLPTHEERIKRLSSTDQEYGLLLEELYQRDELPDDMRDEYIIGVQEGVFGPAEGMDPSVYHSAYYFREFAKVRRAQRSNLAAWPGGFAATLIVPAVFWLLGSILGWIIRGFRQR